MDISQLLEDWLTSEKTDVEPSLLAYVLLYSSKNMTGLVDIVGYLTTYWDKDNSARKQKCKAFYFLSYKPKVKLNNPSHPIGIELLAQAVTPSQSSLDSFTIDAIVQYTDERLDDPALVPRCIDIYNIVTNTSTISSDSIIQVCKGLFSSIKMKKLPQQSRLKILTILGKSVDKYAPDIQRSKINFISGFINCMDGEKDPRNLLVAFELVRTIIDRFDISSHVEDLFDIVFCYFPISFAAPTNDPFGITTEDLKDSLRRCLAATPYFAYYATPLLIEKLMTTVGSAKKDAMGTISLCSPAYGAHAILPHAQDLFDALVREVYQSADSSMVDVALDTIYNVVATLGTGISIANIRDPVEKAIDSLLQQCVQELKEPELKNARSAAYILRAAASASDPACTSVTHAALPIIYEQYKSSDPSIRQKAILDILTELLMASKKLYGSVEDVGYDRDFQTPLLMYKSQILQIFILSLVESDESDTALRQASLRGIHELVLMKQFLKAEEINVAVTHLTRQLMRQDKILGELALSTLVVIAKLYPAAVGQHTLPVLLSELPCLENPVPLTPSYRYVLDAIGVLGVNPALFKLIIHPLLKALDYACSSIGQYNVSYVHDIAATVLNVYTKASKDSAVLMMGQTILLPNILLKSISATLGVPESWYLDDHLVETFATIAAITTRLSSLSDQQLSVNEAFKVFVDGDFSVIPSSFDQEYIENSTLRLFQSNKGTSSIDITMIFTAIVGNCRKEVKLPLPSVPAFLKELICHAIDTTCEIRRLALSKTAASIINKWTNEEVVNHIKLIVAENLLPAINRSTEDAKSIFGILVWVMKSLVIRGHKYGFELLDSVIQFCSSPFLGKNAAESFVTLLHQDDLILSKSSHATVSVLFKQRVFNHCFRRLMNQSIEENIIQPNIQIYNLLALTHLLQNIPTQVATNEMSKLMLPIILALSSHDTGLILSMLTVAHDVVPTAQESVVQHLGSFIHALLRLTQFQNAASVRILALDCLSKLVTLGKRETLQPFKPSVIKELSAALDDKKRIVRKNAVDCREKWYLVGK